jgi:DNA-binding ferritin-like protein (Dps family)
MYKETKELRKLNNQLDNKLAPENNKVLTDIIVYLRGANISEYNQELIRQDLLEMVLSAQERGEDIASVIGEDYKSFADNIVANVPRLSWKDRMLELLDIVLVSSSILGLIYLLTSKDTLSIIRNWFMGEQVNYYISISLGALIAYGIIIISSIFIIHYMTKTSFDYLQKRNLIKVVILNILITAITVLLAWLGRNTVFPVHFVIACVVVLALFVSHKVLERYCK